MFIHSCNCVACAWYDWHHSKQMTMLNNADTNLSILTSKSEAEDPLTDIRPWIKKPVMAQQYNQNMADVDFLDQMLGTYQYSHKCVNQYHTIYQRAREIALVNAYIIYRKVVYPSTPEDNRGLCFPEKYENKKQAG